MTARLLIDQCGTFVARQLVESADGSGKWIAKGEFARGNVPTQNRRMYTTELWNREIGRLQESIDARKVFGELDHPADGKTKLQRTSHIIRSLEIQPDGIVVGEAEIMETTQGRELMAILKAGGSVGVSSRGFGSTTADAEGNEVVAEDYRLVTFDFVADPADRHAYPQVKQESVSSPRATNPEDTRMETLESVLAGLSADGQAIVKKALAEAEDVGKSGAKSENDRALRDQVERRVLTAVQGLREDVTRKVRSELLSDPSVAGAKGAMEELKRVFRPFLVAEDAEAEIKKHEAAVKDAQAESASWKAKYESKCGDYTKLEDAAAQVGFHLHMERTLREDADRDTILAVLKGVKFESKEKVDARIQDVRDQLAKKRAEEAEREKELNQIREERDLAKKKLEESLLVAKRMGHTAYFEQRISGSPIAPKLRKLAENMDFATTGDIDSFIVEQTAANPPSHDYEEVRSRANRGQGDGGGSRRSPRNIDEENNGGDDPPPAPRNGGGRGLVNGVDVGTLRRLSGIGND